MALKYNEKSLKKISEPDKLDVYIRVVTPSAWIVLVSIVLVFVCLLIWFFLGEVEGVTVVDALFGQS